MGLGVKGPKQLRSDTLRSCYLSSTGVISLPSLSLSTGTGIYEDKEALGEAQYLLGTYGGAGEKKASGVRRQAIEEEEKYEGGVTTARGNGGRR